MSRVSIGPKPLARMILVLSLGFFVLLLVMELAGCQFLFQPSDPRPAIAYGIFMVPANALAFSLMGALVVNQRPHNRYGWLMLLFGWGVTLMLLPASYGPCSILGRLPLPFGVEALWLDDWLSQIVFFNGIFLLLALYPDGRFLTPRWRTIGLLLVILNLLVIMLLAFSPRTIGDSLTLGTAENPFGNTALGNPALVNALDLALNPLLASVLLAGIGALLLRYSRSTGIERQQIKWFLFFAATAGIIFVIVEIIGDTIYPPIFDGWFYIIELAFFWIGFPLVIGLAVLRYHLFDIDIIIRRTLVYGALTAVLISVYFGIVLLAQSAFVALTGQESPLAIVISTLVIAALFNPLRRRLQSFIDRRFYRRKYDAQQILANFAQTAREETDMEALVSGLTAVVEETMQPESTAIWLRR